RSMRLLRRKSQTNHSQGPSSVVAIYASFGELRVLARFRVPHPPRMQRQLACKSRGANSPKDMLGYVSRHVKYGKDIPEAPVPPIGPFLYVIVKTLGRENRKPHAFGSLVRLPLWQWQEVQMVLPARPRGHRTSLRSGSTGAARCCVAAD